MNLEEEIEAERVVFYLNFLYGDDLKIETYAERIWTITDDNIQKLICQHLDKHLPELKQDIIELNKRKLIDRVQNPPSAGTNIEEIEQKLKWVFHKGNYTEFYESVIQLGRIYLMKDQSNKAEMLYKDLKEDLDYCENMVDDFKSNGFYHMLSNERNKHIDLITILTEVKTYNATFKEIDNNDPSETLSKRDKNIRRWKRIINKIDSVLRNKKHQTVSII